MMKESIGIDDGLFPSRIVYMSARDDAQRFGELFAALFHRFHRHDPVDFWQPSPEALALLEHLSRTGPLTVREAGGTSVAPRPRPASSSRGSRSVGCSSAGQTSAIGAGLSSGCPTPV